MIILHRGGRRYARGFTLIEILVIIGIIAVIAPIVIVLFSNARARGYDARRKIDVSRIGHFFSAQCYLPNAGPGEYDLIVLFAEMKMKYPDISQYISQIPRDPNKGTDMKSYYFYLVNASGTKCVLYANLDNESEPVTLPAITDPVAGGGTGVLRSAVTGWNGSTKYFQVSN